MKTLYYCLKDVLCVPDVRVGGGQVEQALQLHHREPAVCLRHVAAVVIVAVIVYVVVVVVAVFVAVVFVVVQLFVLLWSLELKTEI